MAASVWKASLSDRSVQKIRNDVQGDWLTATYGKSETRPDAEVWDLPTRAREVDRQASIGVTISGPWSIAARACSSLKKPVTEERNRQICPSSFQVLGTHSRHPDEAFRAGTEPVETG
jgi:hypothetical protein